MTAGAFVWTERQKLQPPPFEVSEVTETFSPVCRCDRAAADIGLEFRRRTRLTLEIADEDGNVVRPLVSGVQERGPVVIRWNGRDANGNVVPEGTYRPRARIGGSSRVFLLPNRIVVDTTQPQTTLARVEPKEVPASGRGRVELDYVLSERAQPLLYVNGRLHARGLARRRGQARLVPARSWRAAAAGSLPAAASGARPRWEHRAAHAHRSSSACAADTASSGRRRSTA